MTIQAIYSLRKESLKLAFDSSVTLEDGAKRTEYVSYTTDLAFTLPKAKKEGYSFLGWYLYGGDVPFNSDYLAVGEITLYPKFSEIRKHQITFTDNGFDPITVTEGEEIKELPDKYDDGNHVKEFLYGKTVISLPFVYRYTTDIALTPVYVPSDWEIQEFNGTLTIQKALVYSPQMVIPESISGKPVKVIGEQLFQANTTVKTIRVKAKVDFIQTYAFADCEELEEVYLDGLSATTQVAPFIFCNDDELSYVKTLLPLDANTGKTFTYENFGFTVQAITLELTDAVSEIPVGFLSQEETTLRKIIFPSTVQYIDFDSGLAYAGNLHQAVMPEGVKYVDFGAFPHLSAEEIRLPKSVDHVTGVIEGKNIGHLSLMSTTLTWEARPKDLRILDLSEVGELIIHDNSKVNTLNFTSAALLPADIRSDKQVALSSGTKVLTVDPQSDAADVYFYGTEEIPSDLLTTQWLLNEGDAIVHTYFEP